jgi:hypothetical protein
LYGLLVFAVRFPTNADPTGWRRQVDRLAAYAAALSAVLVLNLFFSLIFDYSAAWYGLLFTLEPIVVSIGALAILVANARSATKSDVRRRLWWVIAGLGMSFVAYSFNIALNDSGNPVAARVFANLQVVVAIAIAYGSLRREVIDVRVVIDRALAYSVTTAAGVGILALAYWAVGRALAATQAALALQILAALGIGAGLHRLHGIVGRKIDMLVFARVRRIEQRLARVARALDECENAVELVSLLLDESAAVFECSGAILYERRPDGEYVSIRSRGSAGGDRSLPPSAALVRYAVSARSPAPFEYDQRLVLPVYVGPTLYALAVYEDRGDDAELDEREGTAHRRAISNLRCSATSSTPPPMSRPSALATTLSTESRLCCWNANGPCSSRARRSRASLRQTLASFSASTDSRPRSTAFNIRPAFCALMRAGSSPARIGSRMVFAGAFPKQ